MVMFKLLYRQENVATHVRVKATVQSTAITTVSDNIVISTGLPDQNSFSLSVDVFNPEGWQYDGGEASKCYYQSCRPFQ